MKASDNGIKPKTKRYSPFIISNVFSCPNTKKYVVRIPIKASGNSIFGLFNFSVLFFIWNFIKIEVKLKKASD